VVRSNVFSSESIPIHHEGLLIVKTRPEPRAGLGPLSLQAVIASSSSDLTTGLSALAYYERAGMIKRVVPLRRDIQPAAADLGMATLSAVVAASEPAGADDADTGVSFVELEPGRDVQQLQAALANDPYIMIAARVPVRYLAARAPSPKATERGGPGPGAGIAAVPPQVQTMWNLAKIFWQEARNQPGFHDADDIRVAVLDTGVDQTHRELQGQINEYHWQHPPDLLRPVSDKDIIGHGTHVSGTIAALISGGVGVKGICRCKLGVWKIFEDDPTFSPGLGAFVYFVNPIMYRRALAACVQNPVDVMNLSIGGRGAPDPIERSLFEQLIAFGTIICAAMGNERQQGSPISYPAAIPGVIAVGATGLDDRVTVFSNSGNHIALSAPGKAIWSALPTYAGQTGFAAVIGPDGQPRQGRPMRRETDYDAWDGTSMATPHVTGCVALLLAKNNGQQRATPDQAKKLLMQSADKVAGMNGEIFSPDYGAGRLNLMRLLQ
jgi:subtilisin family serine protease